MSEGRTRSPAQGLFVLAALVIVIAGIREAAPVLVPFSVAAFLSILTAPLVLSLERRGVPAWLAVSVVMLGLVAVLAVFGALLTTTMSGFDEALPVYQAALGDLMHGLGEISERLPFDIMRGIQAEGLEPRTLIDMLGTLGTMLLAALSNTALVLLAVLFMLLEVHGLPRKLRSAMDDPSADLRSWAGAVREVQRYLVIKTLISMLTGILVGTWLWVLGVDFAILWGLVAFLLNYVPNVGSIIAAIPGILVAILQPDIGVAKVVAVTAGYLAVNMIVGNIVEPQWLGRRLGLSPLIVLLSLVFWGFVWGTVGMLLSVPLTMVIRIALEHWDETHWFVALLGPAPALDPASRPVPPAEPPV